MAAGGGGAGERSLEETPTWAVAIVCAVFVIISFLMELGIHSLGKWFQKRQNKAMIEALEKIKSELMILGFISLLLTVSATYIAKICVPAKLGDKWLPCPEDSYEKGEEKGSRNIEDDSRRKLLLLSYAGEMVWRRALAADGDDKDYCAAKEKVSLISYKGVHQLHIFIFVLAVLHVLYSVILMALGHAKMKKWKAWELETASLEYQFSSDPARFRLAHQTTFVRRHGGMARAPGVRWIVAFLRQFFGSISKVDYLTIRNGFINAHFAPNAKFDFHRYIKRSMEDDYKRVLGISIPLWSFVLFFLLLNFSRWHTISWISLIPLLILVLVGTKLELVIMEMAQQIQDKTTVVRGAPVVEPTNDFFWFSRPHWILFLIHFTLFENAYQMAYFLWSWYEFGIGSCMHENLVMILLRVFLGLALQALCSYITFPLYALVTQMGSHMKKAIFEEQTAKALKKWHQAAKNRKKLRKAGAATDTSTSNANFTTPDQGSSPLHLLHNFKCRSNAPETESYPPSPTSYQTDNELSDLEASARGPTHDAALGSATDHRNVDPHPQDFSFVKL
ncbi:MLO protein homolog 1-like [Coffea eugenioides]|uniref:MLO protein homolog 1-like n=1 Tax=Coffea eugenioides TaxID=49369 RepID=UPI000F613E8B|nr:MLO protein homolog 1-like [Coffea eugenioides]